MKFKKVMAVTLVAAMTMSFAACGNSNAGGTANSGSNAAGTADAGETATTDGTEATGDAASAETTDGLISYADLKVGEDLTDLTAEITFYNNRTDMAGADYKGKKWDEYIADFNALYPNITVNVETITDYAETALLYLQNNDWGDIMLIPAVDKADLSAYFEPYGTVDEMGSLIRFASKDAYNGICYGVSTTGDAQGIVYNKKVFEEAGVTELPKTPEEFMAALKAIKENTDAIPLYTNYAAGWTMGAWDAYINGTATGDAQYMNQKLLHTSNPFSDPGDGTHAYNVYKILYDAVAEDLTEDDYMTTDWEGCKGMINNGEIGCMVLGSWAYPQMRDAGDNGADIGYMPFPITVDGKQYATSGGNYSYGINVNASDENKQASLIFVKWMTEQSKFAYNEGGMPIALNDDEWPDVYKAFEGIEFVADEPAVAGEEDLLNTLNSDSELNINSSGDSKIQDLIVYADNGQKTFDEIMNEWNEAWTSAQEANGVEITE